jgi:hypothetical protein
MVPVGFIQKLAREGNTVDEHAHPPLSGKVFDGPKWKGIRLAESFILEGHNTSEEDARGLSLPEYYRTFPPISHLSASFHAMDEDRRLFLQRAVARVMREKIGSTIINPRDIPTEELARCHFLRTSKGIYVLKRVGFKKTQLSPNQIIAYNDLLAGKPPK